MSTLLSVVCRISSSPIFCPTSRHDPPFPSTVMLVISSKRAPGRLWQIRCDRNLGVEHSTVRKELKRRHALATGVLSLQGRVNLSQNAWDELDDGCSNRAHKMRIAAHMDSVEVEVLEETNGGAVHDNSSGETLLSTRQSSEEIRLKSRRGTDFAGAPISSQFWEWRDRWHIHYESAGMENTDAPALLLLPGFGVGSFHYDQQLRDLGQEYRVWAMDFLGQGKSWPTHDPAPVEKVIEEVEGQAGAQARNWGFGKTPEPWAQELVYSVDTWRDQVYAFVEKVIGGPVYIVGNSLGGYVGTYFAATNPELVKGVTLLNATPFWAFMPNAKRYPLLARLVPWRGFLPVPVVARVIIGVWWDILRNPQTLRRMLAIVYADRSVINEKLVRQMLEATDHPAAAAAFASIVFAPRAQKDFRENLIRLKDLRMPVCLIYGREDPWVVPFWGQRAKQRNQDAVYYELSPAGHCPHHEAPEVVNTLLRTWVESVTSQGAVSPLFVEAERDEDKYHWFVIENLKSGLQEKKVSVQVKGSHGFWRNLLDSIREIFSKQALRTKVVMAVEEERN